MERVVFGKTGLRISTLGFGSAPVGILSTEEQRAASILHLLLDGGVTLIDTAASYAGAEELIGKHIGHRRGEYILVSKCGRVFADDSKPRWSPQLIRHTVDESLRKLRTDHLDVMLLHTADVEVLKRGEAMAALEQARRAGKVRFIGASGDNEAMDYAGSLPQVDVIELSVNIADQANIDLGLATAHRNNVGVLAKRPIANAAWREPTEQQGFYAGYAGAYHQRLKAMGLTPEQLGFSGDPKQAWPEIALRFTLSLPGVHSAIIGTTNPDNARQNIAAAEKGPLPDDVVHRIRQAFRDAEAASGKRWEALE